MLAAIEKSSGFGFRRYLQETKGWFITEKDLQTVFEQETNSASRSSMVSALVDEDSHLGSLTVASVDIIMQALSSNSASTSSAFHKLCPYIRGYTGSENIPNAILNLINIDTNEASRMSMKSKWQEVGGSKCVNPPMSALQRLNPSFPGGFIGRDAVCSTLHGSTNNNASESPTLQKIDRAICLAALRDCISGSQQEKVNMMQLHGVVMQKHHIPDQESFQDSCERHASNAQDSEFVQVYREYLAIAQAEAQKMMGAMMGGGGIRGTSWTLELLDPDQ